MNKKCLFAALVGVSALIAPLGAFGADHTPADKVKLKAYAGLHGHLMGYTRQCEGLDRSQSIKGRVATLIESVEKLWGPMPARSFLTAVQASTPLWSIHYMDHGCESFDPMAIYAQFKELDAWWVSKLNEERRHLGREI